MMPGFDPTFFFNYYEQYMSQMFFQSQAAPMETTSADGKPLLTPSQFFSLASHTGKSPKNGLEEKAPKQSIQKKIVTKSPNQMSVIDIESSEMPKKNKENENNDDLEVIEPLVKKIKPDTASPAAANESIQKPAMKNPEPVVTEPKKNKLNNVVKVISSKRGELLFGVTRQSDDSETDDVLTREDILKEDPMLLVYYYEKHLLFDNVLNFDPAKLTKV